MTREEAIEILEEVKVMDDSMYAFNDSYLAALDMAIDALKMQEPVEPTLEFEGDTKEDNWYSCPICDDMIYYGKSYCEKCGKKMKWE